MGWSITHKRVPIFPPSIKTGSHDITEMCVDGNILIIELTLNSTLNYSTVMRYFHYNIVLTLNKYYRISIATEKLFQYFFLTE